MAGAIKSISGRIVYVTIVFVIGNTKLEPALIEILISTKVVSPENELTLKKQVKLSFDNGYIVPINDIPPLIV
jgi:hypothetical protein